MTQQVTLNGNLYSDDGSVGKGMAEGEFRENLLPMLSDNIVEISGKVTAAQAQAVLAQNSAAAAAVAAATVVTGPGSNGTSTTSLTVAMGVQSLVIQSGKTIPLGAPTMIASSASPDNWMHGTAIAYNPGTGALQVNVKNIGVVAPGIYPTLAAWTVSLSGPASVTGVLNELKGAPVASAATVNLDTTTGNLIHLTGNITVNAITLAQGAERTVIVDAAPLLTNSANLALPGGANIQAAAGDTFTARGDGGGKTVITQYTRANGSLLAGAGATAAEVKAGTATNKAVTPAAQLGALGFSAYFQSADQAITKGGLLTIAHGLGRAPMFFQCFLKCLTDDSGYVAGEVVVTTASADSNSSGYQGVSVRGDAANILVRFGDSSAVFPIVHGTTGGVTLIGVGKWAFFVRAWA